MPLLIVNVGGGRWGVASSKFSQEDGVLIFWIGRVFQDGGRRDETWVMTLCDNVAARDASWLGCIGVNHGAIP